MTLRTTSQKDSFSNDAEFRAFVTTVHDHLAACCTQTGDTGQINLSTATRPTVGNSGGYEIWRFNDSLQSTAPIFFKIEYGSVAFLVSNPQIWLTVGTGSDGAGTITATGFPSGTIMPRRTVTSTGSGVQGAYTGNTYCHYQSDGSGFAVLLWPAGGVSQAGQFLFSIERFRNADGTANGDGVNLLHTFSLTSATCNYDGRFFIVGATQPTTSTTAGWPTLNIGQGGAAASVLMGTTLYPWPVFTGAAPRLASPSQMIVLVGGADMGAAVTFAMTHYGTSRTWLCAGNGVSASGWGPLAPNGSGFLKSFAIRGD